MECKTPAVKLGDARGLCGGEEDVTCAEQLVVDAEVHFNAPSIIHSTASASSLEDFISSDNRDITVNYFEILYKNQHLTQKEMATESLMRGQMHGILIRALMASGVAKAPKKGKVPKSSEEMTYRCHSLLEALERSTQFIAEGVDGMGDIDQKLWESSCALCQVIIMVIVGTPQDTLAEREKAAVSLVEAATESVKSAQSAFESCSVVDHNDINVLSGATVCQLLPDRIVSLYTLVETTATLFALFGWGKRKRLTKPASGALANLTLSFRNLLSGMMQTLSRFRAFGDESENTKMDALVQGALGAIYKQPSGIETNDVDEQDSIRRATVSIYKDYDNNHSIYLNTQLNLNLQIHQLFSAYIIYCYHSNCYHCFYYCCYYHFVLLRLLFI